MIISHAYRNVSRTMSPRKVGASYPRVKEKKCLNSKTQFYRDFPVQFKPLLLMHLQVLCGSAVCIVYAWTKCINATVTRSAENKTLILRLRMADFEINLHELVLCAWNESINAVHLPFVTKMNYQGVGAGKAICVFFNYQENLNCKNVWATRN